MVEILKKSDIPEMIQTSIQELIKRKTKIMKPHLYCVIHFWIFVVLTVYLLMDFFLYFIGVSSHAWNAVIRYIFDGYHLFLFMLLSFVYACYQYFRTEEKKRTDKFERLREEIIENVRTEWPTYLTKKQMIEITDHLKKVYQINLYYKG